LETSKKAPKNSEKNMQLGKQLLLVGSDDRANMSRMAVLAVIFDE
jgi:hypothetical protein